MKEREALDMIAKLQMVEQTMEAACKRIDELKAENKTLKEALAQPEQKPFRFTDKENWLSGNGRMWSEMHREDGDFPIYTTPPQRTWVGLTKKEVHDLFHPEFEVFHQRIEAKLKEKNT